MGEPSPVEINSSQELPLRAPGRSGGTDWRVWPGLMVTIIWPGLLPAYIVKALGRANFNDAPMYILGAFLRGAFTLLALLWLVIGYRDNPPGGFTHGVFDFDPDSIA